MCDVCLGEWLVEPYKICSLDEPIERDIKGWNPQIDLDGQSVDSFPFLGKEAEGNRWNDRKRVKGRNDQWPNDIATLERALIHQFRRDVGRIELDPISCSPISPHIDPPMPCRVGWLSAGVCAVTGKRAASGVGEKAEQRRQPREPVAMPLGRHVATPDAETSSTMSGAGNGPPVSTFSFVQRPSSSWSPGPTSLLLLAGPTRLIIV